LVRYTSIFVIGDEFAEFLIEFGVDFGHSFDLFNEGLDLVDVAGF
jgi:hypothetical protein